MYRIMIVDDETLIQNSIQNYITEKMPTYQITGVYGSGVDALNAFRRSPADIVLIDIRMPQMDGLELIRQLNQLSSYYVPIIISSYSEFSYAKTAMQLGVIHYLLKPIDFHELEQSIEAAARKLNQRQFVSSPLYDQQDKQEVYLTDLFRGYPADKTSAALQCRQLGFPFTYESSAGTLLKVTFLQTGEWRYGKESLPVALCNILRMLLQPDYLFPLFYTGNHCHILLIHPHSSEWDYDKFVGQTRKLLNIELTADPLYSFSSLEDLRSHDHSDLIPDPDYFFCPERKHAESAAPNPSEAKSGIQAAIEYMNEHYMEDLTREDVASKVFMSGAHFSRCFKKETGITYLDYLTDLRMKKAIELLQTNCKIQDIGKKLGYPSQNRFIINFRHYTSYTPSEYRRKVLKIL